MIESPGKLEESQEKVRELTLSLEKSGKSRNGKSGKSQGIPVKLGNLL